MRCAKAAALLLSLVPVIAACKSTNRSDSLVQTNNVAGGNTVLLVYMGGFNSCSSDSPDGLYGMAKYNELKTAMEGRGKTVLSFFSCYNGFSSTELKYRSNGGAVQTTAWDNPRPLFDAVKALSNDHTLPTYVIGHSYGGWLSSSMAMYFGGNAIRGLYTIDPISPYHCNQGMFAATVAASLSVVNAFTPPNGCERAPSQYTSNDNRTYPPGLVNNSANRLRTMARAGAAEWRSYYQTKDYLHSSAIPQAGGFPGNTFVRYWVFVIGTNSAPHVRIHIEKEVWDSIRSRVLGTLGLNDSEGADETIEVTEAEDNDAGWELPPKQVFEQMISMMQQEQTPSDGYDPLTPSEQSYWNQIAGQYKKGAVPSAAAAGMGGQSTD